MNGRLGFDYLSPSEPIGMLLLLTGILFTVGIIYIFSTLDKDSLDEAKRKKNQREAQQQKIKRLYPPE